MCRPRVSTPGLFESSGGFRNVGFLLSYPLLLDIIFQLVSRSRFDMGMPPTSDTLLDYC